MAETMDDKTQDLASSDQAEIDVADMPDAGDATDAGSSPATKKDATESDTLSIVRDVSSGKEAASEGSSPKATEKAEAEPEPVSKDDVDFTDAPFHKHPRFQQLLSQKKEFQADATRYRNIERFMSDNGLEAAEVADGMQIMALAKTNPVAAWERIRPWAERIAIAAGVIMPPDIQKRVTAGELTPAAAQELSLATARAKAFEAQNQSVLERQQAREAQMRSAELQGAAGNWEQMRRVRDPNFEAKLPALQREIAFLQATEGKPDTPQGVSAQLEKAYASVNAALPPPRPAAPAARPKPAIAPVKGGEVAGNPRATPGDTLSIIRAAVASRG